jgi:hypothetical protein
MSMPSPIITRSLHMGHAMFATPPAGTHTHTYMHRAPPHAGLACHASSGCVLPPLPPGLMSEVCIDPAPGVLQHVLLLQDITTRYQRMRGRPTLWLARHSLCAASSCTLQWCRRLASRDGAGGL